MSTPTSHCHLRPLIPAALQNEVDLHIEKVREQMRRDNIEALLVNGNANIYYLTLRYFRGYIWIPLEGDPVYFVIRPGDLTGDSIIPIRKPEQIVDGLTERAHEIPKRIGLEFGELYYSEVTRLQALFPDSETVDSTMTLRRARMVKTDWEQHQMRYDGAMQSSIYRKIPELYREGMTDMELQIVIETELRQRGNLGYARVSGRLMEIGLGSVISGDNADVPSPYDFAMGGSGISSSLPGGADGREMTVGTTVMVDMNGMFNGYQSDMTRTWAIGDVSELAHKAHRCSIAILRRLEELGRPGYKVADMYRTAAKMAEEEGLKDYFMGHCQSVPFIGHGVGIELNEIPVIMERSRDILAAGMTLAIEPKFVIPGVGAVGAENTYIVTADGLESITKLSEELTDLL